MQNTPRVPLLGPNTLPRPQTIFVSQLTITAACTTAFSPQISYTSPQAAFVEIYKNGVLWQRVTGNSYAGPLPIATADARSRVHWDFYNLDQDQNTEGTYYFATDCNFDAAPSTVTVVLSTTTITQAGQQINVTPIVTPTGWVQLSTAVGSFGSNAVDGTSVVGAVQSGNSIPLTLNYTHADNGTPTLTIIALDAGGNSHTIGIPVTVNIPAPAINFTNNTHYPAATPGFAFLDITVSGIPNGSQARLTIYDGTNTSGAVLSTGNTYNIQNNAVSANIYVTTPATSGSATFYVEVFNPSTQVIYVAGSDTVVPS